MTSNWEVVRLGDVATLHYGKQMRDRDRTAGTVPVVGSSGIFGWHNAPDVSTPYSIVVGRKGTAGSVTWFDQPVWASDTSFWVEPKIVIDPKFLYLALVYADLPSLSAQTGVPGLNRERAYSAEIPLPPLAEQRRIVDLIGALDDAIEAAGEVSGSLQDSRVTVLDGLFSSHDDTTIGALLSGINGGKSPGAEGRPPGDGEYGVLKVSAVGTYGFRPLESKTVSDISVFTDAMKVRKGDVLISRANTSDLVGAVCLVDDDYDSLFLCDKTLRLVVEEDVDSACLVAVLNTTVCKDQIRLSGTGTSASMKNISQPSIRNLRVKFPATAREQALVGGADRALLEGIGAAKAHATSLRNLRSEMLTSLLSGAHTIPESYDRVRDVA